ncbi:cyclic nucleotide-binding domain-containing protein [Microcoleus sp. PH2017_22_RUC_O_B]|uniref:cyclic nucleotide-binding domain-containing protein n=1 Tax=Microcoleus sp. PH2017_22_RUC_O_B TaxID=2798833 RepID=UPI0025FA9429|nr:cyclic nucleotide-binding domain-containing protein [Microcoleus sp. PH2017_22_RUC_O_B]
MSKVLVILGELSDRDIDWMLANGSRTTVSPGTTLIVEGKPLDALYIVLDGTLSVTASSLGDKEIGKIICGEVLGEMSFVDGRLPSASVTTIDECLILSIPRRLLTEKLEQDVLFSLRFYRAITKFLSSRLRGTVRRFGEDTDYLIYQDPDDERAIGQSVENPDLAQSRFEWLLQRLKGRRKKEEGRRKKEEGRRKKEEGRRKKEEGRRKKGRWGEGRRKKGRWGDLLN